MAQIILNNNNKFIVRVRFRTSDKQGAWWQGLVDHSLLKIMNYKRKNVPWLIVVGVSL